MYRSKSTRLPITAAKCQILTPVGLFWHFAKLGQGPHFPVCTSVPPLSTNRPKSLFLVTIITLYRKCITIGTVQVGSSLLFPYD